MSFEIRERDLLGRIGRLETKSGTVETPILLPVVNPAVQPIPPKEMRQEFDCSALITNAYIIKKHFAAKAVKAGIHGLLDFDGVIMTDSGAYQILVYGDVATSNKEIVQFQEQIGTDVATMLDLPTGWGVSAEYARHTVKETLKRARELDHLRFRNDILWVGPVQGGTNLDLVAESARAIGKLQFQIHALGSPTPVMEQYLFDILVDMIMAAKPNLPSDRPFHLFGAGHPFMFALAVALGCDFFDSAAYALFAREDRYLTETGTMRLNKIEYFPCSCAVCAMAEPADVKEMPKPKRQEFLARHNLHMSLTEIKRIKQAILEGRLWEYLEIKSHGHPALLRGFKRLKKYSDYLEAHSAVSKNNGLLFYGSVDLARPEVVRHRKRLLGRYSPPERAQTLLLLPQTRSKPFHRSREHSRVFKLIERELVSHKDLIHVCTYAAPFGVTPVEIDEVYPLSQYEAASPFDSETISHVAQEVGGYIEGARYKQVILLQDTENWTNKIALACRRACSKNNTRLTVLKPARPWTKSSLMGLVEAVEKTAGEKR